MDEITNNYNSSEDENTNNISKFKYNNKINIAPIVNQTEPVENKRLFDVATKIIHSNPSFDELYAPVQGPKFPKSGFELPKNTLTGNTTKLAMDNFIFDEKYHTFKNYGYATDPDATQSDRIVGDKSRHEQFGGSTVFRENPLKRKKYKKPKREKSGDPGEVDGYLGPWAKFEEDEDEIADMKAKQRRMKELYEQKKSGSEAGPEKEKKNDETEIVGTSKPVQEISLDKLSDCAKESTVFEYIEERDYQGRTYMHCAHEHRQKEENHRCFIPTKKVHCWSGHKSGVSAIRFFPQSGHLLLSGSLDKTIKVWDVNGHRRCLRTCFGHNKGIRDLTFNADGTRFMSVSHDQWIKLWDTETGKVISRFNSGVAATCARFYPRNENEFIASQVDKLVVGWDARKNEIVQKYDEHLKAVNAVVFIDQSRKFVSSAEDKKLFIWEYGIPVVVNHISEPYMNSVHYLTESPDGEWFLGQSMDNAVYVYSSSDKRHHRKRRYIGHNSYGHACQVDVSPDGQFIVSGDSEGRAFFWDWKTKRIFKRLKAHDKVTIGVIWHPVHPSKVATCSWDGKIKYWD